MTHSRRALPTQLEPRPWSRLTERASLAVTANGSEARAVPLVIAVLLGAIAILFVLDRVDVVVPAESLRLGITLAALGLGAEFLSYNQTKATSGSVAQIPFAAAVLIAPHVTTIIAIVAVEAVVQIVHRRTVLKATFNTGQIALGLGAGTLAYLSAGGMPFLSQADLGFVASVARLGWPSALLILCVMLVNTWTVSAAISLTTGRSLFSIWADNTLATSKYFAVLVLVAFYVTWLSANLGILGTAGMAIPMIAVRQLYKTTMELTNVTEELLDLMVAAIEARDPYTSGHSQRVARASKIIARSIGLNSQQIERVTVAALLHDVGKIDEKFAKVLAKEGRLTPDEWAIMKQHPIRSAELVGMLTSLKDIVAPVRHHHENWDGTGYPLGLSGESIPLASRIIMFADTLDAITTDRPYRKALGMDEAKSEFVKFKAKQFDPNICDRVISPEVWAELYLSFGQRDEAPLTASKAS